MVICDYCARSFPVFDARCPHCSRPAHFPNVRLAGEPAEQEALANRYEQAISQAPDRARRVILHFERKASASRAVMSRTHVETLRMANSHRTLHQTYEQQVSSHQRLPDENKWDALRAAAGKRLFGGYSSEIHFAFLSLVDAGSSYYGNCAWVLREELISHRASVFEENSALFVQRRGLGENNGDTPVPRGFRAVWEDRGRLSAAKLASTLSPATRPEDFAGILLRAAGREDDDFVEVHIGGSLTVLAIEKVTVLRSLVPEGFARVLASALAEHGVIVEER
jgi:hypothetical protein